jgi:hypothetical protein
VLQGGHDKLPCVELHFLFVCIFYGFSPNPYMGGQHCIRICKGLCLIPRNEIDLLPKFDGGGNTTMFEHIQKYEFVLRDLLPFMRMYFAGCFLSLSKVNSQAIMMPYPFAQFKIDLYLIKCLKMLTIKNIICVKCTRNLIK